MISKHTRPDQQDYSTQLYTTQNPSVQAGTTRPGALFRVLIDHDGGTTVDGVPFHVPEGEPVHVTVLDVMHHHAQSRGEPVEVAILDRQHSDVTLVEVAPDGSSRILLQETHDEGPVSAAGPPTVPAVAAVPDELADLVGFIRHSLDTGELERAAALAFRLREHAERRFGPDHQHTLEAHALEAYVAHRSGNPLLATGMCLELARIRHRHGDPRALEEVTRAAAAWLRIDEVPAAVDHGRALLAVMLPVWSARANQGRRTAADAVLPRLVNRRMRTLTEEPDLRVTGAA
ncbi:hypothetical protein [Streptomyces mirabilis]|uniref:hypothetical protein n=1 Tax=Streptomyces mirabilis TaxID=68239 RepID=UPI003407C32E